MPKHVKEAYRLLNKSIIRVDQPDIHLDEDEAADEMDVDEPTAGEGDEPQVSMKLGFFVCLLFSVTETPSCDYPFTLKIYLGTYLPHYGRKHLGSL
jgi:hypothetical protein